MWSRLCPGMGPVCTLWQTQGRVERLQATEEAATESWDPSNISTWPRLAMAMAMAVGLSVPAGSGPIGWESAWGCERRGQHGKWMTVPESPVALLWPLLPSLGLSPRTVVTPDLYIL